MTRSSWSVPETEVFAAAREALDTGQSAALVSVVDVRGSAYRPPGAKMVVPEDGGGIGSVTAGCLEEDVRTLAADVLAADEPRMETFDLMEDDDVWGLGVGCNGVIDVLIEPLTEEYRPVLSAFEAGENVAACTVLAGDNTDIQLGDRAYYDETEFTRLSGAWPDWLTSALGEPADEIASRGGAETVTIGTDGDGTTATVFIDGITPPPELFVFGTGHDVAPVCELAKNVDFRVTVVGFRGASATEERFPAADRVLSTAPGRLRDELAFDENTYAVVMTHNFVDDRLTVEALLPTGVQYIGLMGPRERFEEMQTTVAEEGEEFPTEELHKLYTPVGLDLGGDTPYQIAHSIVSELLVVHNERTPRHLKTRDGRIHERLEIDTPETGA